MPTWNVEQALEFARAEERALSDQLRQARCIGSASPIRTEPGCTPPRPGLRACWSASPSASASVRSDECDAGYRLGQGVAALVREVAADLQRQALIPTDKTVDESRTLS
ncbi:hypothetical protein OV203_33650 [Nannocystis sp. ILAH1]|uniref:hypothetical protein n=1 Tax=Nannocystis sp. ILAH1 TaxID=2996789 RepID=UPI00226FF2B2|nr:hypothetical protein [Nannocystis sp. ILAH1]MCY0992131.1 hypothetical protein [Nannocystis sp. ILAH1]